MVNDFEDKDLKGDVISATAYTFFIAIIIVLGFWSFTAGRGAEEQINLVKLAVFSVPMLMYLIYVWGIKVGRHVNNRLENIFVLIHDKEYSAFGDFKPTANPLILIAICIIIFSIIGLTGTLFSQSGIGNVVFPLSPGNFQEQVTPGAKVLFSVYGSPAENAILFLILSILVTIQLVIAHKLMISKKLTYFIMILPNSLISAWIWLKIHNLVVGGDQIKELAHFMFGFNSALLTLLTGSIIPMEVYHMFNNLFNAVKQFFGSEYLFLLFGVSILVVVVVLIVGVNVKRRFTT